MAREPDPFSRTGEAKRNPSRDPAPEPAAKRRRFRFNPNPSFETGIGSLARAWIALALAGALLAAAPPAVAQTAAPARSQPAPPRPAPIDRNGVLILIRATLIAVQQANQTGNYGVLYGLSAPGFQSLNQPARLAEIFAGLRAQNFDLSGVAVLEPQLTVLPEADANGVMRLAGYFPSVPLQVNFDLQFAPVEGRWRLLGISVNVGPPTPVAPQPESPRPAEAKPPPQPARPAGAAPKP